MFLENCKSGDPGDRPWLEGLADLRMSDSLLVESERSQIEVSYIYKNNFPLLFGRKIIMLSCHNNSLPVGFRWNSRFVTVGSLSWSKREVLGWSTAKLSLSSIQKHCMGHDCVPFHPTCKSHHFPPLHLYQKTVAENSDIQKFFKQQNPQQCECCSLCVKNLNGYIHLPSKSRDVHYCPWLQAAASRNPFFHLRSRVNRYFSSKYLCWTDDRVCTVAWTCRRWPMEVVILHECDPEQNTVKYKYLYEFGSHSLPTIR